MYTLSHCINLIRITVFNTSGITFLLQDSKKKALKPKIFKSLNQQMQSVPVELMTLEKGVIGL